MNWNKIVVQDNGCWLWTGALNAYGYGWSWDKKQKKSRLVHRMVWEEMIGPIENTLDHVKDKCSSRACCNPEHLEDVTQRENKLRSKANRNLCPQGHEYAERRRSDGARVCYTCFYQRQPKYRAQRRQKKENA